MAPGRAITIVGSDPEGGKFQYECQIAAAYTAIETGDLASARHRFRALGGDIGGVAGSTKSAIAISLALGVSMVSILEKGDARNAAGLTGSAMAALESGKKSPRGRNDGSWRYPSTLDWARPWTLYLYPSDGRFLKRLLGALGDALPENELAALFEEGKKAGLSFDSVFWREALIL